MKILVSGAGGFVGMHLVQRLLNDNHHIVAIVRPSTVIDSLKKKHVDTHIFGGNAADLISFMQAEHFDGVIHLASLFLAGHKPEDVAGLIDSNILFATSLLEASVQAEIPWFINTGTFWQHYENKKYSPVNLYAATKQAFEDMAQYYLETSPINFVTIKLSDTFGPGDTRPKIFNLWSKVSASKEHLDMSPGEQVIDISFIDNVIDGYTQMITLLSSKEAKKLRGHSFAITSNERMTLKQLARVFEKVTETTLAISWGKRPYRPREVMMPWETGETIPGWQSEITLEEGIRRTFHEK